MNTCEKCGITGRFSERKFGLLCNSCHYRTLELERCGELQSDSPEWVVKRYAWLPVGRAYEAYWQGRGQHVNYETMMKELHALGEAICERRLSRGKPRYYTKEKGRLDAETLGADSEN